MLLKESRVPEEIGVRVWNVGKYVSMTAMRRPRSEMEQSEVVWIHDQAHHHHQQESEDGECECIIQRKHDAMAL